MKKVFVLSLILLMSLVFTVGCGSDKKEETDSEGKLVVVTTMYSSYDFAKQVVKDKGEVVLLIPPGAEAHSFEPSAKDLQEIENCDLLIYNGGKNEAWVEKMLSGLDRDETRVIEMTQVVDTYEEELVEGMTHEEDHHDEESQDHTEMDEHVWMSLENAGEITQAIAQAAGEIKPEEADFFMENSENYQKDLEALDEDFREVIQGAKRKTLVFGDRFPARYFVEDYQLEYYAAFPGCSGETEASSATVSFLIDKVKEEEIPVVFHVEMSNQKMAQTIAEETDAEILEFHSIHNVTQEDMDQGVTYVDLMRRNLENIERALN